MATTTYDLEFREVDVPPTLAVQTKGSATTGTDAISSAMQRAFGELGTFMGKNGLTPAGPPRAIYDTWGPEGTQFTVAMPIVGTLPVAPGEAGPVFVGMLPGRRALRFLHRGPYSTLKDTYARIDAWLRERGDIQTESDWTRYSPMWEEYLNDPSTTPESEMVTRIYLPLP